MTKTAVDFSYLRSFLCVLAFVAMYASSLIIASIFGRNGPAWQMMVMLPLFAAACVALTTLILAPAQCLEAWVARSLITKFGDDARYWTLCALPFTAILTWYCFDYLTPQNLGINVPGGSEYQHGITLRRYSMALGAQTLVTLLNIAFLELSVNNRSPKVVVLAILALAVVLGAGFGYYRSTGGAFG